jgi:hypothetical protein
LRHAASVSCIHDDPDDDLGHQDKEEASIMALKYIIPVVILAAVAILCAGPAQAGRSVVNLKSNEFTTVIPKDVKLGKIYTVAIDVPNAVKNTELLKAFLEIKADVSSVSVGDYVNDTPVVEVYSLTDDFDGVFNSEILRIQSPVRRNVRVGQDRTIRIDITSIAKEFIADPSTNHGLIVGSLTGSRDGVFNVKSSSGIYARITYYYDNR